MPKFSTCHLILQLGKKQKLWGTLLGFPINKFTLKSHTKFFRRHRSLFQSCSLLSDPTVHLLLEIKQHHNHFESLLIKKNQYLLILPDTTVQWWESCWMPRYPVMRREGLRADRAPDRPVDAGLHVVRHLTQQEHLLTEGALLGRKWLKRRTRGCIMVER